MNTTNAKMVDGVAGVRRATEESRSWPLHFKPTGCALVALIGFFAFRAAFSSQELDVRAISSRPDTVSGGDILAEVSASSHSKWTALLNNRDVTLSFHRGEGSGAAIALLSGLKPGKNIIEIRVNGATRAKLEIVDHPLSGPIFSGPHQQPFICQTEPNGLGSPLDPDCTAKTVVQYYYKSTDSAEPADERQAMLAMLNVAPGNLSPGFKPYNTSGPPPSDVAQIVTADGQKVPYTVRREIGTINRAVYDIQFLHQPGQPLPTPWTKPTPGWNGRLVYDFGAGCTTGYRQGTLSSATGSAQEQLLKQGYAIATSTLNDFENTCNDRISAETLSMVKEHFIKEYGVPVHTIGEGGSGGSVQVHLIAQNYPGLLDGIIPIVSFPDIVSLFQEVLDCSVLGHAFETSTLAWSEQQKTAASGFPMWRTCAVTWLRAAELPRMEYPQNCHQSMPKELIYDRVKNPHGVRCDLYDNEINVFGRDPLTGFARRPLDNVGVQYGLLAFNSGKIDAEHFIDLNARLGGHDEDGTWVAHRTKADPVAVESAYKRGLVLTGGGLSEVPIIDFRMYLDDLADNHVRLGSFITRARLIAANGSADNQVILVDPRPPTRGVADPYGVTQVSDLVRAMDRWLDKIAGDHAEGSMLAKIARNKPAELADGCIATDGERIVEPANYDATGRCNQIYPPHGDPRLAAGAPLTNNVLKCALKSIDPRNYIHPLSDDQLTRLKAVFPTGVCDYSRPGIGQQGLATTWQHYQDEPDHVVKRH